jgi:hypothetical protein
MDQQSPVTEALKLPLGDRIGAAERDCEGQLIAAH